MSRDKQIEEMAWLKCCCHSNKGICGMDGKPCDLDCGSYHEAKALYNAGYRKASEVAEEIIENVANTIWKGESDALNIPMGERYYNKQEFIAELKKKYTEGGK